MNTYISAKELQLETGISYQSALEIIKELVKDIEFFTELAVFIKEREN